MRTVIEFTCQQCGKSFTDRRVWRDVKYCTQKCYGEATASKHRAEWQISSDGRICTICLRYKEASAFYTPNGKLAAGCKACNKAKAKLPRVIGTTRICKGCEMPFQVSSPSQRRCRKGCGVQPEPRSERASPAWRACKHCMEFFMPTRPGDPRQFCTQQCYWDSLRGKTDATSTGRTCLRCGTYKSADKFSRRPRGGLAAKCKVCANALAAETRAPQRVVGTERPCAGGCGVLVLIRRGGTKFCEGCRVASLNRSHLGSSLRKYGLTVAGYQAMHEKQRGRCAICGGHRGNRRLAVDHCHATGELRELLCSLCNIGLGAFADNTAWLRQAAEYLEFHATAVAA